MINPWIHPSINLIHPSIQPTHDSIRSNHPQSIHQSIHPTHPSDIHPSIHPLISAKKIDWENGQKKGRKARQHARRQKEPLGAIRYKGDGGVWWGVLRSNLLLELELSQIAHLNGKKRHGDDDDHEFVCGCCRCCCGILIIILRAIPIFLLAWSISLLLSFFLSYVDS